MIERTGYRPSNRHTMALVVVYRTPHLPTPGIVRRIAKQLIVSGNAVHVTEIESNQSCGDADIVAAVESGLGSRGACLRSEERAVVGGGVVG